MRVWLALVPCVLAAVGASGAGLALARSRPAVRTTSAASGWSRARQMPGTETMSRQAEAVGEHSDMGSGITSVDCPARAYCAVSGGFVDRGFNFLVFAGSEHAGTWDRAAVLLGIERGGRWEKVQPLRGAARALLSVSCPPAAGRCAAGGVTTKGAFVIDEHGSAWARYQSVAGARWPVTAMSCPAAGACLAAGGADPRGGGAAASALPFIASESGGRWTAARPCPASASSSRTTRASIPTSTRSRVPRRVTAP